MAVSEKDFVNVESGTDETYVALDQEVEVYDVEEAIDDINGTVINGNLEQKVDYLSDTKDMIRQAIINKGQPVEETASFRSYAESIDELSSEINNQDVLITENGTYEAESGYTGLGEVTVEVQPALQDKVITQNGTYRADTGYDGLGNVVVNTPVINNQDKTITENGVYTADSGYSGLGEITVEVPQSEPTLDTLTATANGNYTPPTGIDGYDEVVVNVQPDLQDKTITTNGTYSADSGFYGLGEVVVSVADTPAVIDPLSITPSTNQQVITASSGIDGFSPITVGAVTSAIDSNIQAGNIKSGVSILGVAGSVEELHGLSLTVTPSTSDQLIQPQGDYNAFDDVFVNAVDSTIDSNIQSANIVSGVSILGVNGSATVLDGETVSITPTTSQQVITPTSPHNGITQATVAPVTSAIDSNIAAGNIKSGVSILGVTGSVEESNTTTQIVSPSTSEQTFVPTAPYNGFGTVVVSAVDSSIDSNIVAGNIKDGVTILGVQGTYTGGGITPTGTKTITNNGIYDITNYANVDVSVPTTVPTYMREYKVSSFGMLEADTTTNHIMSFDGVPDIGENVMYGAYTNNSVISGVVEMKDLVRLSGVGACQRMCQGCHNITSVNLPELVTISGNNAFSHTFFACRGLVNVNMPKLKNITGTSSCATMFAGEGNFNYYNISSIDLSSLETITGWTACESMFNHTGLINVDFYSLRVVSGYQAMRAMLAYCIYLTTVKFWALQPDGLGTNTNQFNLLLVGCSGVTVHFPSNLQSVIGSWSDVQNGFGGTNTTVLFDLPATVELVGSNTYRRNPKYDTTTALGWYDTSATMGTPYYTSGTTDPTVGDYIYSDATCTTQVDTIASIS